MDKDRKKAIEQLKELKRSVDQALSYLDSDMPMVNIPPSPELDKTIIINGRWKIEDLHTTVSSEIEKWFNEQDRIFAASKKWRHE